MCRNWPRRGASTKAAITFAISYVFTRRGAAATRPANRISHSRRELRLLPGSALMNQVNHLDEFER